LCGSRKTNPTATSKAVADIQFGNYYALVIGANAYKHLPKLKTAINDAKSIAAKLENLYGFKVRLLLDPTRDDIIDAFDDYLETLEFQDNLLNYYAGHGWLDESTDRGYWLPVDAKKGRRSKWLSNADITDTLKSPAAEICYGRCRQLLFRHANTFRQRRLTRCYALQRVGAGGK